MKFSLRLQLLTCLVLYASCAHAIMVKFGTKGGPIEPPPPEPPLPAPQPSRVPAPVWEERLNDNPDPNAQWRPQLFIPQPRYTQIVFNNEVPINNAQRFVNSYVPRHQPIQAPPTTNYFTPSQILSSQSLPGFGIRYFLPAYVNDLQQRKQEFRQADAKHNEIETNDVVGASVESPSDAQWKYEKEATKRTVRHPQPPTPYPYQFPAYIPRRQQ
ncbi:uncharacterized protein LOC126367096 [Pectinophora gossypiella]|uniref:uncharacterized protein LOC126367096 n=1 Tax=Pectinophora gossypiella TaxID=13191 RepID=UPI00214E2768|nr:uncharacterized protein LOC126367096 [Pectinophora gossypiella]